MPRKGDVKNLSGLRFGRLLVTVEHRPLRSERSRGTEWLCLCDCGTSKWFSGTNIQGGNSESCGCLRRELLAAKARHGHRRIAGATPEYQSWAAMLARVRSKTGLRFRHYGARGITVCERWTVFENFLADMGPRPGGKTLDRVNNDGNYELGNCRWATASEQNSNKRNERQKRTSA